MPYIRPHDRGNYDHALMRMPYPRNPGELNYVITKLIAMYMEGAARREPSGRIRYTHINDVLGALEGAKLEFYRRVAAPYETVKQGENGDVYS